MLFASELGNGYIRFAVSGAADGREAPRLLEDARRQADAAGRNRVLLDLLAVAGDLSTVESFNLGVATVQAFGPMKIAVLQLPRAESGFAALVASNRGGRIAVFAELDSAVAWLLAG